MNNDELTKELDGVMSSAKQVSLSVDEKATIKNRISAHMTSTLLLRKSRFSFLTQISFGSMYLVPALAILLIISGGSASFLATNTLPGDTLYPVKLNFNESVESLLAISPESKAEVNLRQASERLDEAEVLNLTNNLTEVKSEQIQANFSKKIDLINKNIEDSKKSENIELAEKTETELENKVNEHRDVFVAISNSASNSPILSRFYKSEEKGKSALATDTIASNRAKGEDENPEAPVPTLMATTMTMQMNNATLAVEASSTTYTLKDVKKHKKAADCWAVVKGEVYDITPLIKKYPVGYSFLKSMCGTDATKKFNVDGRTKFMVNEKLEEFKIGTLKESK